MPSSQALVLQTPYIVGYAYELMLPEVEIVLAFHALVHEGDVCLRCLHEVIETMPEVIPS
jgi:hypothetical protein